MKIISLPFHTCAKIFLTCGGSIFFVLVTGTFLYFFGSGGGTAFFGGVGIFDGGGEVFLDLFSSSNLTCLGSVSDLGHTLAVAGGGSGSSGGNPTAGSRSFAILFGRGTNFFSLST